MISSRQIRADSTEHISRFICNEYKKLHSLECLVRTTLRTKTSNITKDDFTCASHQRNVAVLQK